MIPIRVTMTGWMRYRETQVADFSEGNLISICGDNGAGKSSIFDAITFALYGRHRLGAVGTEDLITEDGDGLEVELEFENDGRRFKVHRGRSRGGVNGAGAKQSGTATSALYTADGATGQWMPVPGTNTAPALQLALNNILRISEQAFTSSFMLTQGAATQFLDARPAERFRVISNLINLEAYERLEKGAREAAKNARATADTLERELGPLSDVTPTALDERRRLAEDARNGLALAAATLDAARRRLDDAKRFHARTVEIEALQAQIDAAQALISRRAEIEDAARRAESLAAIQRTLGQIGEQLEAADTFEREADQSAAAATAMDLSLLEDQLAQGRDQLGAAHKAVADAEEALRVADQTERDASAFNVIAAAVLSARARRDARQNQQTELSQRLGDLDSAREESESLSAITHALPELRALMDISGKLETLANSNPTAAIKDATANQKKLEARRTQLATSLAGAETTLHKSQNEASAAAARLTDAREQLEQRHEAAGEAVCSRCGQAVTPEHAATEIAELESRIAAASTLANASAATASAAGDETTAARAELDGVLAELKAIEVALPQLQARAEALAAGQTELKSRQVAFAKLAPPALLALTKEQDSAGLRTVLASHGHVPVRQREAARRYQELLGFQGQLESATRELVAATSAVSDAESRAGVRLEEVECAEKELAKAQEALGVARAQRDSDRHALLTLESVIKEAETCLADSTQQRASLLAKEASARVQAQACRETAVALSQNLPESMQRAAIDDCAAVLQQLDAERAVLADAPAQLERLHDAERQVAAAGGELRAKNAEIASIPEAHRISPEVAEAAASAANEAHIRAAETEHEATSEVATMEQRAIQKENLERRQKAAAERGRSFTKLARLMGKSGLQGVLVTNALETITHHANAFLSRLTGASLQLILKRGTTNDELDLHGIDTTCMREARSIQALSGSQKFRCAVAMAYGIGQYAGAGGMRSIVIDEGFGSLDEVGQDQMVEELKALAQHMDKVIVVSHLPTFQDREHFPVRIWVEKSGTASLIRAPAV